MCHICANSYCDDDECSRSMTQLACCAKTICCGCLLKSCYRCVCKEECDAVMCACPYCRTNRPVEVLDMYLGGKAPCTACVRGESAAAPVAAAVAEAPVTA